MRSQRKKPRTYTHAFFRFLKHFDKYANLAIINVPRHHDRYAFQAWVLPDTVAHVVAINMVLNAATQQYVHHLVLHDCTNSALFQALTGTPQGNPYPNTATFTNAFNNANFLSEAQSLVGNTNCKAPIWAWAHGSEGLVLPPSVGIQIGVNGIKYLIAEIHYNNPNSVAGLVDTTGFQLVYTTTLRANDAGMCV